MKNIFFLTIFFISFTFILSVENYKCGEDLELDTCYIVEKPDKSTTNYYLKACPKGKYCETELDYSYNTCVKRKSYLDIGDKCAIKSECITGQCSDKKCIGTAEGGACDSDKECDKGLYCESNKCAKYVDEGGQCSGTSSYKPCKAGYVCANSVCTQQFSIANGAASDNSLACKSNFVYDGKCAQVASVSQCVNGKECTVKITTAADSDTTVTAYDCYTNDNTNDCAYYQWQVDRLSAWKDYLEEFEKKIDDIKGDEDLTSNRLRSATYFVYTYLDKKLNEKDILYYRRTRIPEKDGDCIKDYYVRQQGSSYINVSILSLTLFVIFNLL